MLVDHGPLFHLHIALAQSRAVSQRAERPDRIAVNRPLLDQDLDFQKAAIYFNMVQLFTEVAAAAVAASIERALLSRSINRPCYLAKTLLDEGRLVGLSSRATGNCSDHIKRYSIRACRRSLGSDEAFSRMP